MTAPLHEWRVVLVSPSSAENVGAVARVMRNFGCETLWIVDPRCEASSDGPAGKLARFAKDILDKRREVATLDDALGDTVFSAALTRRGSEERPLDFTGFVPAGERWISTGAKALVLGREDRGLSTDECARCTLRWEIPTVEGEGGSMNLAQAATVALAGVLAAVPADAPPAAKSPATQAEIDGLVGHLEEVLAAVDFGRGVRLEHNVHTLRLIAMGAGLSTDDVRLLRGICRRVMNKVGKVE
jgi:tRNA/rRNA methyltransferase